MIISWIIWVQFNCLFNMFLQEWYSKILDTRHKLIHTYESHNLSTGCVRNRFAASLSTSCNNAVILSSCYKVVTHNLLTNLSNCRTITRTTCNKSVELNNLVASCQQTGNKQCEHILLTSCWNSIATSLLQVCYNLCVFTFVIETFKPALFWQLGCDMYIISTLMMVWSVVLIKNKSILSVVCLQWFQTCDILINVPTTCYRPASQQFVNKLRVTTLQQLDKIITLLQLVDKLSRKLLQDFLMWINRTTREFY
jgi:hypothetical protein